MESDSREPRNDLRKYQPEVGREATMGPELIRGGVAESQGGVDVGGGDIGAGKHGGNLRLPLCRSVVTLRTLLCEDLNSQRPPKPGEVLKDRQLLDCECGGEERKPLGARRGGHRSKDRSRRDCACTHAGSCGDRRRAACHTKGAVGQRKVS